MPDQTLLLPAVINAKMVFRIGIIMWAMSLIGLAVAHFAGVEIPSRYPVISGVGIVLGVLGYWWAHHNHLINDEGFSQQQITNHEG